jgi:hypothetical protein
VPTAIELTLRRDESVAVRLTRDDNTLRADLEPAALNAWWNGGAPTSWLPPADAQVTVPTLVIDGIELEGVQVQPLPSDDASPANDPPGT